MIRTISRNGDFYQIDIVQRDGKLISELITLNHPDYGAIKREYEDTRPL